MKAAIARREGLLTSAWYGALFFAFGAHLPYWPVWLADWGLTQAEIGSYLGLGLVLRVIGATALPALADYTENFEEWETVGSDYPYHYLGSVRTYGRIGKAFGEAVLDLRGNGNGKGR